MSNRPQIQIDDEVREMTDEEYQAFLARLEASADAPSPYSAGDPS